MSVLKVIKYLYMSKNGALPRMVEMYNLTGGKSKWIDVQAWIGPLSAINDWMDRGSELLGGTQ